MRAVSNSKSIEAKSQEVFNKALQGLQKGILFSSSSQAKLFDSEVALLGLSHIFRFADKPAAEPLCWLSDYYKHTGRHYFSQWLCQLDGSQGFAVDSDKGDYVSVSQTGLYINLGSLEDARRSRLNAFVGRLKTSARHFVELWRSRGYTPKLFHIVLTYGYDSDTPSVDRSKFLDRFRKLVERDYLPKVKEKDPYRASLNLTPSDVFIYTSFAESHLSKTNNRLHFHVYILSLSDLFIPKPDKSGLWEHGHTRIEYWLDDGSDEFIDRVKYVMQYAGDIEDGQEYGKKKSNGKVSNGSFSKTVRLLTQKRMHLFTYSRKAVNKYYHAFGYRYKSVYEFVRTAFDALSVHYRALAFFEKSSDNGLRGLFLAGYVFNGNTVRKAFNSWKHFEAFSLSFLFDYIKQYANHLLDVVSDLVLEFFPEYSNVLSLDTS